MQLIVMNCTSVGGDNELDRGLLFVVSLIISIVMLIRRG